MVQAIMCPQCNAPLTPHKFARSVVCSFCGATVQLDESSVSASKFHTAFLAWNSPASYQVSSSISIGNRHWSLDQLIGQGDISDVYSGQLVRWPTELVIIKVLRNPQDADRFDNEWHSVQVLQNSNAPGADTFTMLIPQPVIHGDIPTGAYAGRRVSIFRQASGFQFTFAEVMQAYPQGIPHRASIWIWRRILEILSFIHASGIVHGAILPEHLLVQKNEHGVRLIGYSAAGRFNEKLRTISPGHEGFYPKPEKSCSVLTAPLDLIMSARCIATILGGVPETATLPDTVPVKLADLIRRIALSDPSKDKIEDAWTIREKLGQIAEEIFGPPQFIPIVMPPPG